MTKSIILFDMDGVLLEQEGYHTALMAAVKRIGAALGMPNAAITPTEIARFEAMSVTNEWDSQSICAALMLIDLWKQDGSIRYDTTDTPCSDCDRRQTGYLRLSWIASLRSVTTQVPEPIRF